MRDIRIKYHQAIFGTGSVAEKHHLLCEGNNTGHLLRWYTRVSPTQTTRLGHESGLKSILLDLYSDLERFVTKSTFNIYCAHLQCLV